jgi:leucine dehydrogenase
MFEELLGDWDGELLAARHDAATDAWLLICVHSTVLGPAMGGTRMKVYPSPHDALRDGLRLAQAMSMKQAAADLPFGGGKAVLAVQEIPAPGSAGRRSLLESYAGLVDSLNGTYVTAADMNTSPADLDVIGERTPYVMGRSPERGGSGDSGGDTAVGVFHGLRAAVRHAFGDDDLSSRTVVVQGVGSVGGRLARMLSDTGATLILSDIDAGRADTLAAELGATTVQAGEELATPCDVFAPCATGGILDADAIGALRCRVVAGAANNQLATPADGERLAEAGILYAPDYVINAGGVIHLAGYETLGWDEARVAARLAGIGQTLADVFAAADRDGVSTSVAADRLAAARIEAGRS